MLSFNSAAEEEATLEMFNLCLHATRLDLEASEDTFLRILSSIGLSGLEEWVNELNPSSAAPYHGSTHEKLMTCYAFMGSAYRRRIGWSEMRCIVAAASLHDFDHTGVTASPSTDDSVNIERAIAGVQSLFVRSPLMFIPSEQELIIRLIRCTRYPYLAEPTDILEMIMRDADMCMPYVQSPIREQLFHGLRQELAASGRVYTLEAFADGVVAFYGAGVQHTEWAGEYAKKYNLVGSTHDLSSKMRMG